MEKITYILDYLHGKLDAEAQDRFEKQLNEDAELAAEVSEVRADWRRQRLSDWLSGQLPEEEAKAVALELQSEESLRKELEELKQAKELLSAVHQNAILQDIEKIAAQEPRVLQPAPQRLTWIRAASILLLITALGLYFLFLPARFSNSALSQKYLQPYPGKGNLLALEGDPAQKTVYAEGITQYDQAAYEAAISSFKQLSTASSYYSSSQFYTANALLALDQAEEAIPILVQLLSENNDVAAKSRLQWYLALAHLDAGQEREATEQLNHIISDGLDLYYQGKAQQLLLELDAGWRSLPGVR